MNIDKENTMFDSLLKELSIFIKDYRREHKMTQVELAKHLGISQAALSRIENSKELVSLKVLKHIIHTLGGDIEFKIYKVN